MKVELQPRILSIPRSRKRRIISRAPGFRPRSRRPPARRSNMKREYHRWYSHRLGMEMGVVVYGHWGAPLMGFPTSAGDEWELDRQGMIGALAPLIEAGRTKFFSVNSVNWAGFYNKSAHPFHRSYMQAQLDAYLREEVVPFIWDNSHSRGIAADRRIVYQKFCETVGSGPPWTIGARRAGTTCPTGITRCGNTSRSYF